MVVSWDSSCVLTYNYLSLDLNHQGHDVRQWKESWNGNLIRSGTPGFGPLLSKMAKVAFWLVPSKCCVKFQEHVERLEWQCSPWTMKIKLPKSLQQMFKFVAPWYLKFIIVSKWKKNRKNIDSSTFMLLHM